MGRPVIATNVPGCAEVVDDKITGLLCRLKDHNDLFNKMEVMINMSIEERKIMGIKGREKIMKEFNQDIVINLYLDALES
jgi:glycosyltransferase involved in cell wall biosynthesis